MTLLKLKFLMSISPTNIYFGLSQSSKTRIIYLYNKNYGRNYDIQITIKHNTNYKYMARIIRHIAIILLCNTL